VDGHRERSRGGLSMSPATTRSTSHDRTFLDRIREAYAKRVLLMVMIDLGDEKKSLGVISVT
jgi:hypothetical protein